MLPYLIDQGLWLTGTKGDVLTREGEPVDHLYYLADGEARVMSAGALFSAMFMRCPRSAAAHELLQQLHHAVQREADQAAERIDGDAAREAGRHRVGDELNQLAHARHTHRDQQEAGEQAGAGVFIEGSVTAEELGPDDIYIPAGPFMSGGDPRAVEGLMPDGVRPDVHEGRTYVGLIPFRMVDAGLGSGPAVPWLGTFLETNVRLYSVDGTGRRGIVFLSLDTDRAAVVLGARAAFGVPYRWARMRYRRDGDVHTYDAQVTVGAPQPLSDEVALDGFDDCQFTLCATTVAWPWYAAIGAGATYLPLSVLKMSLVRPVMNR